MSKIMEDKEKAFRIYDTICDDFDAGHYESCASVIRKNRELLATYLSPVQDRKLYKIHAYSIFTLIEDSYLAGNIKRAGELLQSHADLLENHLSNDEKKTVEAYREGEIPESGESGEEQSTDARQEPLNAEIDVDRSGWTVTGKDFDSVIKSAPVKETPHKKQSKVGVTVAIVMIMIVVCGVFFASPMIKYFAKNTLNTVNSGIGKLDESSMAQEQGLQVIEPPPAPPKDQGNEQLANSSLIGPNVKINENGYILSTDSKIITAADLTGFDEKSIRLATNEMFARKGFAFGNTGEYYNYFSQFQWYNPDSDISIEQAEGMFSETEKANLMTLLNFKS